MSKERDDFEKHKDPFMNQAEPTGMRLSHTLEEAVEFFKDRFPEYVTQWKSQQIQADPIPDNFQAKAQGRRAPTKYTYYYG